MDGGAARSAAWCTWLSATMMLGGCLVGDEACDRGRVELKGDVTGCICAPGHVPDPDMRGCSPCSGANEEARGNACECLAGFRRTAGVCAPIPDSGTEGPGTDGGPTGPLTGTAGLGDPCSTPGDCEGKDATFCMTLATPPVCVIQNCSNGMRACSGSDICCDYSPGPVGTLLPAVKTANGLCVPMAGCMMGGGTVVTP
jgi:hypothetical protein